jgi:cellulose synthase/poly-beta-1,6-N-acetylglucosamine synthase-like glycosyltransferase
MFRKRTARERFWEILPGLQIWTVFLGALVLSYYRPVWAACFIVCFDLYWLLKAVNVSLHLLASYRKFRFFVTIDWLDYLQRMNSDLEGYKKFLREQELVAPTSLQRDYYLEEWERLNSTVARPLIKRDYRDFYHLVIIPFVDESFEVLQSTLHSLSRSRYPMDRIMVILAAEERVGQPALDVANKIMDQYGKEFYKFFVTIHPDGLPGEIKGKSANCSYSVQHVMPQLEADGITVDQVLVANFDSDTIVHPQYFARVAYEFLTSEKPYRRSYQPITIYNNNIWDSPALIRVVSVSNSFWQFTEGSRPDRLRTFSSHSMTLRALVDVGFWKKDLVNEDGYIYWQCYLRYDGDYEVVPLLIPVSLDTCLAETFWQTLINQYKQKRRWAYNVEYYPHLIMPLIKSKAPFWDRMYKLWQYVEGDFNWAAASVLISILGWLPLIIGGQEFLKSVVAFNLPLVTKTLMTTATLFLICSVYINLILLPPRPKKYGPARSVMMYLQWFLVPIVSVVFGSLPAIEAQTRLMLGFYLEFFVTPKARKGENTALQMKEMQTSGGKTQ